MTIQAGLSFKNPNTQIGSEPLKTEAHSTNKSARRSLGALLVLTTMALQNKLTGATAPLTEPSLAKRRLQEDIYLPFPETDGCRITDYRPDRVRVSVDSICKNTTLNAGVVLKDDSEIVESHAHDDVRLDEQATCYRSTFHQPIHAGPNSYFSDLQVFGRSKLGLPALNEHHPCYEQNHIHDGMFLPIGNPRWEVQGNLSISAGIELERIRPLLDQISAVVLGKHYDLRVFPGSVDIGFDQECQQIKISAKPVNDTSLITPQDPNFVPLVAENTTLDSNATNTSEVSNLSPDIQIVGSIPNWVIKEGEVSIVSFDPKDIMVDVKERPLSFFLLGSKGQNLPWAFLDLQRQVIVFDPSAGLLGDDETEVFDILLRGVDQNDLIQEAHGNITVIRLAENCELIEEVIGESFNPLGGLGEYIKCQSTEAATNKSQRTVLLSVLGKTLGYAAMIGTSAFALLTAFALIRDRYKKSHQEPIDKNLSQILYHFSKENLLTKTDDWSKVLDLFSKLEVYPNQAGPLRHVQQYRNDVFKIIGYALPNLEGTNQDFSAKLLRDYLPINQKLKYGTIRYSVGWCGIDGSKEDLKNVIYNMFHTLSSVSYHQDNALGESVEVLEDPIKVSEIIDRLANRLTLLNLPFLASNKVSHFFPVDAASAEMKIWTGALYSLIHCNLANRKESKEMDVLARSDMARMLKVLVKDAKQQTAQLTQQFFEITTQANRLVEAEPPETFENNDELKNKVKRELFIHCRVNAMLHMILDHEIQPKQVTWDLVQEPVRLKLASRFNTPETYRASDLPPPEEGQVRIRTESVTPEELSALEQGEYKAKQDNPPLTTETGRTTPQPSTEVIEEKNWFALMEDLNQHLSSINFQTLVAKVKSQETSTSA